MTHDAHRSHRRVTLAQVASAAGVSQATASIVLGGKSSQLRISDGTRSRVLQAAEELDYAPNLLVHSIQSGRTGIISFFTAFRHRLRADLYMDRFSSAIENAAGRFGYDVLVTCNFNQTPRDLYSRLNGGRADGVLVFAPLPDDPLLPLLRGSRLPVVLIGARDSEGILPSVKDDVASGMDAVAEALVERGHRRIAAIVEEGSDYRKPHERVKLLRESLRRRGVDLPDSLVVLRDGDCEGVVQRLLDQPDPPTAIFCWRDFVAYRTIEACEALGVAVPERVSIVGYDGLQWPAATHHVAASVQVDLEALACAAVEALDQHIRGAHGAAREYTLPVTFQAGTTLGRARTD